MSMFAAIGNALKEANDVRSEDLGKLRRGASKCYLAYLWAMTGVVTALAAGWSEFWTQILVINVVLSIIATIAHLKAPDAVHTRATVAGAMLANWMNLIYASSAYGGGEFILDAHMIYFVLNSILLAYFCWRTLFIINAATVVHHLGLNFLAPMLIWPSADLALQHLVTHCLMATVVTVSGLIVSVTVCRLFRKAELSMASLQEEMATRERLEAEESRRKAEAIAREEEERRIAADREAAERKAKADAEAATRERELQEMRDREAARQKEEALQRAAAEEQSQVVEALAQALKRLSQGDLAIQIGDAFPSAYETLRIDFNATVATLAELLAEIAGGITAISSNSAEISAATGDLARRTEQSAVRLEKTSTSVLEVTDHVKSSTVVAKETDQLAESANSKAMASTTLVNEAISAMTKIEGSSQEIGKIVDVIGEIAFQTNLLALNAGVEAARAGEAGRGFAVVASEVRALAQRSSEAAKEINALISSSSRQVDDGARLVGSAGNALSEIIEAMSEIAGSIGRVAHYSDVQATNIQAVNSVISELDSDMQRNAAMAEETTAAVQSMSQEAERLKDMILKFSFEAAAGDDEAFRRIA